MLLRTLEYSLERREFLLRLCKRSVGGHKARKVSLTTNIVHIEPTS